VTVNPSANGFVKDLDATVPGFQSTGNLWICKGTGFPSPLAGADADLPAGQAKCNQLVISELLFFTPDADTCNDDNDGDGAPCAGTANPAAAGPDRDPLTPGVQNAETGAECTGTNSNIDNDTDGIVNDGCLPVSGGGPNTCPLAPGTENYIPGQTSIDCNGGEVGEGLGAFEFQIKYDHKLFQQPAIDCTAGILDDTGRVVQSAVTVITENWTLFGCVTKNGVGGTITGNSEIVASNQDPDAGGPLLPLCNLNLATGTICQNTTSTLVGGLNLTSTSEVTVQFLSATSGIVTGLSTLTGAQIAPGNLTSSITGTFQQVVESGTQCFNNTNDNAGATPGTDNLGLINEGCPVGGPGGPPLAESGLQCFNNTSDEVGADADTLVNDGCPSLQSTATLTLTITGGTSACAAAATGQKLRFNLLSTATGPTTAAVSGTYQSLTFWPAGLCGAPLTPGVLAPGGLAATVTVTIQPDLFQRIRPTKDNGVITDLLDENCEIADIFGMPFAGSVQGGLTPDCRDATITIRMLEGDVDLDCDVDVADDQALAFRYGSFFGNLLYNKFYDLEPNIAPDFDIDIKDLQTVFGRNGSLCKLPIPDQPPGPQTPDP
jgi:hypothetical protein